MKANSRLWRLLGALISFPILSPALAQEEIIITAPRLAAAPGEAAYAVTRIDAADLAAAPTTRLDATLAGRGGFSLFRRADSRSANPTTQGATLRGLGPNGAGRALVLLDGVPQNDPFGGWVYWSALPQAALEKVALHRGGGAGPFGAGALSGVIDMTSAAPAAGLALDLAGGSFGSGEGALLAGARMGDVGARLSLSGGTSDGFFLLPRSQRGAIDVPAAYDNFAGGLDLATALGGDVMAALRLAGFAERRVNGLAAAPNETEGLEASLRLAREGAAAAPSWLLVVYGQAREFSQVFAAVDEARASARPVLDQFDVPARAAGLRGDMRLPWGGGHATRLSIDARWAQGETNERFRDLGDGFTRLRRAGGAQLIAGLAVEESWTLARGLILTGGLRLDHWRNVNGIRQESDLATGALLVDEKSADQKGWRPSARLGAAMPLTPALTARLAAYSAFRVPTLNELHRPFRVRNDITEANPALRPEKLKGVEGGLDYAPLAGLEFTATLFANWLGDAVGNVTLATGPGVFPIAGFVPAGGSLRQRRNIDGVRVVGLELGGRAEFAGAWALEGSYVYNAARVTAALMAPDLVGTRLVQVPRHQGQMTLRWQPAGPLSALLRARAAGRQFDDDLNTRVLKGYGALDAALRWQVDAGVTLFANGENLTDSLIEAARDGDGLVTRTTPRSLTLGLRLRL